MTLPTTLLAGDFWSIPYNIKEVNPDAELFVHINSLIFQYTSVGFKSTTGTYVFELASVVTRLFAPGRYGISITSMLNGRRTTLVSNAVITIEPDPITAMSFSFNQRMVYAYEALLEGRITSDDAIFMRIEINGRKVIKATIAEIQDALNAAKTALAAEDATKRAASGLSNKNTLRVRFRNV